jgi:hypothetical protein
VFDPARLKGPQHGAPNEVMVLGTAHLSHLLPTSFDPALLDGLLDRLAGWKPQIIAIESMSGPLCALIRQYPGRYEGTFERYCFDTAPARAATGLDVAAATAEVETMLAHWPADPSPAQRRKLASRFLAGGEPASALVQWLRLPQAERRPGDGLDAALVALLDKSAMSHKEDFLIAAPLAARLGLERVVPMDDQAENLPVDDDKAYGNAIGKAWDNPVCAKRKQAEDALDAGIGSQEGVMALYRGLNAPSTAQPTFDCDFGAALEEPSPKGYGRVYVGYWETRNLRMAANIREAIGTHPGSRTLVIVMATAVCAGWLLYRVVETPFMRLRARWVPANRTIERAPSVPVIAETVAADTPATLPAP